MIKNVKETKGITLVALVVTIVVLLILAAVSLNLVIGENGLIQKAKDEKSKTEQARTDEDQDMSDLSDWMDQTLNGNGGTETKPGKVTVGAKADKNSTINGEGASATNPIIPEGYISIDTTTTSWGDGKSTPTEDNVNKGLVITDSVDESGKSNGNEWVWVPIPDASVMYETTETPITLTGGTNADGTGILDLRINDKTVAVSKYSKSEIISGKARVLPNDTSSYREPDIVVMSGTEYDALEENRKTAGFVKAGGTTLTDKTWYYLYNECKGLSASNKVIARMICGNQWDVTCTWIANYGDRKDINDSRAWENYVIGNKKDTGSNEAWKANNIYDFAGNCYEWTQEVSHVYGRTYRGGYYTYNGKVIPASSRNNNDPSGGNALPTVSNK